MIAEQEANELLIREVRKLRGRALHDRQEAQRLIERAQHNEAVADALALKLGGSDDQP